jgi:PilZ domain
VGEEQRESFRVPGPFDGVRMGLLETAVRIFDLSEGGCFVTSLYEGRRGETLVLKIELPHEGWIEVEGETLYNKAGFGYAVRFTSITPHAQEALAAVVDRRRKLAQRAG